MVRPIPPMKARNTRVDVTVEAIKHLVKAVEALAGTAGLARRTIAEHHCSAIRELLDFDEPPPER